MERRLAIRDNVQGMVNHGPVLQGLGDPFMPFGCPEESLKAILILYRVGDPKQGAE